MFGSNNRHIVTADQHSVSARHISRNALEVTNKLQDAGYQAYLVGGCVRDLSLNKSPKDFDVATNATPEEVKKVFRNCRIIGRRFRLAHVYFRHEIIEVSTFRASHAKGQKDQGSSRDGLIIRDNVYGSIKEDAKRRDFTINALYYNPKDNTVIDYLGGVEDLKKGVVRIIDNPKVRYKEDPVRMLRGIRFMCKLNLQLSPETAAPIEKLSNLLSLTAPSRLFEEILKAFHSGHALKNFHALRQYHLFQKLFPVLNNFLDDESNPCLKLIEATLISTDDRIAIGKSVTPAFFFAAILWQPITIKAESLHEKYKPFAALDVAIDKILNKQIKTVMIPRRFTNSMRDIWRMQHSLTNYSGNRVYRTAQNNRFRAAYDLLLLRNQSGEDLQQHCDFWTNFQTADDETRQQMIDNLPKPKLRRRRKQTNQ